MTTRLSGARFSSLYRTAPRDDEDQPAFWNAVAVGDWAGTAEDLLSELLTFEAAEGRVRDPRRPKGPRVLDLDLLLFGNTVQATDQLTLPHPRLALRRFALDPLVELSPTLRDPQTGRRWSEVAAELGPQGVDRTDRTW